MSGRRALIASAVVALFVAAAAPLSAQSPVVNPPPIPNITIQAPPSTTAGADLCVTVTCYGGPPSVTVEINDVWIPAVVLKTDDPSVYVVCCRVPGGASQSTVVITAVSPGGGVASAGVFVH